jgi:hypothetical protein
MEPYETTQFHRLPEPIPAKYSHISEKRNPDYLDILPKMGHFPGMQPVSGGKTKGFAGLFHLLIKISRNISCCPELIWFFRSEH